MLFWFKIKNKQVIPSNSKEWNEYLVKNEGKSIWGDFHRETRERSSAQNRSLHLWFELLAKELNAAGYTVQLVLKEKVDLDFTKDLVKELLWRPAQKALLGKNSTTELERVQDIDDVFDHLNRHIAEKFEIHVPFPNDINKNKNE